MLVADAFYQRDLATRVMRFARRAQARGATVLAADFGRAYLPRNRLTPLAAYDVPGQRVTEDTDTKHTTVWTLAERPGKPPAATPVNREPANPPLCDAAY